MNKKVLFNVEISTMHSIPGQLGLWAVSCKAQCSGDVDCREGSCCHPGR